MQKAISVDLDIIKKTCDSFGDLLLQTGQRTVLTYRCRKADQIRYRLRLFGEAGTTRGRAAGELVLVNRRCTDS